MEMFRVKPESTAGPPVSSGTAEIIRIVEAIKSELRCGICCSTLKDPVITTCNHLFCRCCYTDCLSKLKSLTCPICKSKLSRRNSKEVDIYTNVVSHYLQLAKAFTRDLQPLALKPADTFLESQAVVLPGSVPSPLRNFQPDHQFAIPILPSKRRGKRPAVESDAPSKRKQLKLEVIGEEEEEIVPVTPPRVKRETVTPPPVTKLKNVREATPSRFKQERRSEEPLEPPRRRSSRGKSVTNEETNSPLIEANLDNAPLRPISLVPYSQSSTGSSLVEGTQYEKEEKEVQTDKVEKVDASIQSDEKNETLMDQIASYRASNSSSSSLTDLSVLLKIHPDLANIINENLDEIRHRFIPPDPIQKGRMRQSEVLAQCFATPTGNTDDESEGGLNTKGSSTVITPVTRSITIGGQPIIDRSITLNERSTVDGDKKKDDDFIHRRLPRSNTDPIVKKKKTLSGRKKGSSENSQENEKEESSEEGSIQAERGNEKEEIIAVSKKNDDDVWSDEEEKDETIPPTPDPSEKGEEENEMEIIEIKIEKVEEKKPAEIETVIIDPFAFDGDVPPPVSPPRIRRNSSARSIKENEEKISSLPKSNALEQSYDSFNESIIFDTVPEKIEPLGEINLATMQRTPSRRSPRKTPSKNENKESVPDSFDDECESQEALVIAVCGVTGRKTEELVAEFRARFPSIKYQQHAENGATHLIVLDSVDRHIRASSLHLASAHASKCTVLCKEWMEKCIEKKKLIDTSSFGILSVNKGEAPAWQRAKVEAPILAGYTILLPNNFADSKALPRDRLSALIVKCGGKVVDRPWKLPKTRTPVEAGAPLTNVHSMRSFILFSPGSADADSAMRFERDTSVAVFTADWLVDSLSLYSIIITDTDKYRVALKSLF